MIRLLLALLLALPLLAQAHKPSDAYLSLTVREAGIVEQRLDIALRDLDRELGLDEDGDGQLTWREVRSHWPALEALAAAGVVVRVNSAEGPEAAVCVPASHPTPQLDEHVDGRYAVLVQRLQCPGGIRPDALSVDYQLFAKTDPTHRGIARIDSAAGDPTVHVLIPGAPPTLLPLRHATAEPSHRGLLGFFGEGLHHIAIGADHLLFLVTLLMVAVWRREGPAWQPRAAAASAWREALRLVTAFTVAHSLTLGLAAAGVLAPPSRWVESLIALSVFVAALDNLRPFLPGPRWTTVALFGLVHGFGFAGPLQDLGLRGGQLVLPLLGFNLGVEAGQLIVVAVVLPAALWLRARPVYRQWVVRPGSAVIALIALVWVAERALDLSLWPQPG